MSAFDPTQDPSPAAPAPLQASPGLATPGWYPVDHLSQRYWDGYEWTDHVAPLRAGPSGAGLATSMTMGDQRTYALIMHLGSLLAGFIVPLVMWLIKKDESPFIDDHGKQLMNWHISTFIYFIVSFVLMLVLIGFFLMLAIIVLHFVFSIMGAIAANRGDTYRYPLAIQFIS